MASLPFPRTALARRLGLAAVLMASAWGAGAVDLLGSYRAAIDNEATWLAARAAARAAREASPQAFSQLLPNVAASTSRAKGDYTSHSLADSVQTLTGRVPTTWNDTQYYSSNYTVSLRQPLIRLQNWAAYQQAESRVAAAEASLDKEQQSLGDRVAGAYFEALLAEEVLASVLAQKEAYLGQLNAAKRSFAVGVGTRTDIDEAQARYDYAVAQELESRQNVDYTRQQLELLIGKPVHGLARLDPARMEMTPVQPASLADWLAVADEKNPDIRSGRYTVEAADKEVTKALAAHLPTVDIVASRARQESDTLTTIGSKYFTTQVGIQTNIPLYSGGYINSTVRQARAALDQARHQLEGVRRATALTIRKEFQNVSEGMEKIRALETALRSAELSVKSTQKGLQAGTRTSLDVLNALQQRAATYRDLARSRFLYALARLRLLAAVGELDLNAIEMVNHWLAPESEMVSLRVQ